MDEHGPAEDRDEVAPERAGRRGLQGGHVHLVDQVAEEGRLGEDLDVEEVGRRLERDRRQLVEPVQAAGRVDVERPARRRRDATATGRPAGAGGRAGPTRRRPTTWSQWSSAVRSGPRCAVGPRLLGRRDQDDGGGRPVQAELQRPVLAAARDRHDVHLGRPPAPRQQVAQARGDRLGTVGIAVVEHDHPDGGIRQRVAAEVGVERVDVLVVWRGHSSSRRLGEGPGRLRPAGGRASARPPRGRRPGASSSRARGGRRRSGSRRPRRSR